MVRSAFLRYLGVMFVATTISITGLGQLTASTLNTNFTVSTVTDIETTVLTNNPGFTLGVKSGARGYDLKAQVTAKTSTSGSVMSADRLQVAFVSTTGSSTGYQMGNLTLSEATPTALTTIGIPGIPATGGNVTVNVNYAIKLRPVGYAILPGTYTFTVTITYTDYRSGGVNQVKTATMNVTVTVQKVVSLTLDSGADQSFSFFSTSQFTNGINVQNGTAITVKSNSNWLLTAASNSDNFGYSGSFASTDMPSTILKLQAATNPQIMVSTTPQTIISTTSPTAISVYDLSFHVTPGYSYGPGNYSLIITYTLTAP